MIACGACGHRYQVGDVHRCFDSAQLAARERDSNPPDPVRHLQPGYSHARAEPPPVIVGHPFAAPLTLALYVDRTHTQDGTRGHHLCLCRTCAGEMAIGPWQRLLSHIADLDGRNAQNYAQMMTAADDTCDWRVDFDGCDKCGAGSRKRSGPTELFEILYLTGEPLDPENL